jgi:hypothetical protein
MIIPLCPVCFERDDECFRVSIINGHLSCSKQLELDLRVPTSGVPMIQQTESYACD